MRDTADPTGASVDLEIDPEGKLVRFHALRPRMAGKTTVITPWSGTCEEHREVDGLRVATRLNASWHPPEGEFVYVSSTVEEIAIVR